MEDATHKAVLGEKLRSLANDLRRVLTDDRLATDTRSLLTTCLRTVQEIVASRAVPAEAGSTILIVDDQDSTLYIVKKMLTDVGFVVQEALSAAQAIALASTHHIAAALVDLHLPETSGSDLAVQLQAAINRDKPLPIVGMTSDPSPAIRASARAAGIDVVLQKPVGQSDLVRAMRKAIGKSRNAVDANGEVDPDVLEELRGLGGDALYASFVCRALDNARDRLADLESARDRADPHAWVESLHALHGVVLTLGGVRFSQVIRPVLDIPPALLPEQMSRWQEVFATRFAALEAALAD
jgi:CheY-like chemotaxis protein